MEASNITMFNGLDVSNNDCVLKVRILRLWRLKDNNKPGEYRSIEMILQDEMGHRMQAYVRKACIPKHDVWLAENRGNKIFLTLWDDYLKQLIKYFADNPNEEYLIIVLQFARVKYYGVIDYKKRLLEISSQVDVEVPKPVGSSMLLTVKDEFLKKYPFYSINDLCTILEAKNVIIIGTVKEIVGNQEWYYNGCKRCSRKVTSIFVDGVKVYEYNNSSCNSLGVNSGPRFRIPIRVQDTTGVVSLTLFDRDARQLFNKAADEFVTSDVELNRRQFPIAVCFAMTINKSQGQSLARVGIYLRHPVFTHGQLYVALSRVKSRAGVKMLILDKEGKVTNQTTNVVYKELFNNI
ncbi:replication protein A 70 kDa DNA-binding subunit B-like [Bidens hawaiensis]|uniref:replication protein A 70 kDa DNA-binding subunit B-like n=1 Tax=Bidens hawaiensis TaxID=980011 RepID=UPI004048F32B